MAGTSRSDLVWNRLEQINPEITAWLKVEGTGIDLPVAHPGRDKPRDWYLRHDAWGDFSELGCAYLDARCSESNRHLLVFGHRVDYGNLMFSDLAEAHRQDEFNRLGAASWRSTTKDLSFAPLLALKVDKADEGIQRFDFDSKEAFRKWAEGLVDRASARTAGATEMAEKATRVLTLVTCSSRRRGGRERTVVVFATATD